MKTLYLHLILALVAVPLLAAQPAGSESRNARGRVAWFISTGIPDHLENPITVLSGEDPVELTLSKRSTTEPVRIPQDGILRVVRKVEGPVGPNQPPYRTLAHVVVPETVNQALIILVPIAKPKNDLLFNAKVQDLADFKGGDWLFLNLTNVNIGVDMGKTNLDIRPGHTRIFEAPALAEATNMPIRYRYFHPDKDEWKLLSASTIVLRATRREICIFSVDPRYQRISYHGITFPVSN